MLTLRRSRAHDRSGMAFDDKKWDAPAIQGDVAGIAVYTAAALYRVAAALQAIKEGEDIQEHLDEIQRQATELDAIFNEMTGWTHE